MNKITVFIEFLKDFNTLTIFIRLMLAAGAGACIGIDREFKNRGAGLRTHALVCLGSALAMVVGQYINITYPLAQSDMSRIGAQVISGVGFLGVGTIIVTGRNEVKGLTTAAGLWVCACMGLAFGIGYVEGALITLLLTIVIFRGLHYVDKRVHKKMKYVNLFIEFRDNEAIRMFFNKLHEEDYYLANFHLSDGNAGSTGPVATVIVKLKSASDKQGFFVWLRDVEEIKFFEEINV